MKEIKFTLEGIDKNTRVYYDEDREDYVVDMPQSLSREELFTIVEEIKHITHYND